MVAFLGEQQDILSGLDLADYFLEFFYIYKK